MLIINISHFLCKQEFAFRSNTTAPRFHVPRNEGLQNSSSASILCKGFLFYQKAFAQTKSLSAVDKRLFLLLVEEGAHTDIFVLGTAGNAKGLRLKSGTGHDIRLHSHTDAAF